jgi:hypothetical protein
MKIVLRLLMVSIMIATIGKVVYAQGEAAVPFLELAPDSRAGAMGESGTGLADNSSAIFWNPAGLAFQNGADVSITHSNWLPSFHLDLFYEYLTYKQYIEDIGGTVSASITYMNFGTFARTGPDSPDIIATFHSFDAALTLGYATKLSSDWGLGFNFRLIHSQLSDQPTAGEQGSGVATTVSFDVAAMWRPEKLVLPIVDEDIGGLLSVGVNISNLGPKIYYIDRAQADPIPTNFRLGFAYKIVDSDFNNLIYTLDFSKLLISTDTAGNSKEFYQAIFSSWGDAPFSEEMKRINTSMGLEYLYGTPGDFVFALRTGFFYEDPNHGNRKFVTFGAGIKYDIYNFDFSYITTDVFKGFENHPLNNTLRFSISIGWGENIKTNKGFPRGV